MLFTPILTEFVCRYQQLQRRHQEVTKNVAEAQKRLSQLKAIESTIAPVAKMLSGPPLVHMAEDLNHTVNLGLCVNAICMLDDLIQCKIATADHLSTFIQRREDEQSGEATWSSTQT